MTERSGDEASSVTDDRCVVWQGFQHWHAALSFQLHQMNDVPLIFYAYSEMPNRRRVLLILLDDPVGGHASTFRGP